MQLRRSLTIRSDPASVFRWIEDPALASRWQPDVVEYEITKRTPEVVGTEGREVLRSGRRTVEMHARVTAYEANARMDFDVAGRGIRIRNRFELTPVPAGTRLDVDFDIRLGGPLRWLLEPFARRKIGADLDAQLERLRALCEA